MGKSLEKYLVPMPIWEKKQHRNQEKNQIKSPNFPPKIEKYQEIKKKNSEKIKKSQKNLIFFDWFTLRLGLWHGMFITKA